MLHVWHIIAVAGIEGIVELFPEFIDVVEVEKGGWSIWFTIDVEKKFLGKWIKILKLIFYKERKLFSTWIHEALELTIKSFNFLRFRLEEPLNERRIFPIGIT